MLAYITLIFACQLAGELIVVAARLPLPGPVVGMAILFAGLLIKGSVPKDLGTVGDTLLNHLSLLFVPAGVGVMVHGGLIAREWLPLTLAVLVSTLLTVAVTGLMMAWLAPGETGQDTAGPAGEEG